MLWLARQVLSLMPTTATVLAVRSISSMILRSLDMVSFQFQILYDSTPTARGLHRPYRAEWLLLTAFPTLKRGANDHCASGAKEIGISLINKMDSCDCPGHLADSMLPVV